MRWLLLSLVLAGTATRSEGDGQLSFPIGRGHDDEFAPYYFVDLAIGIQASGPGTTDQAYASCVLDTGSSNLAVASQALQSVNSDSIPLASMAYDTANPYGSRVGSQTFGVKYVKGSWTADVYRGLVGLYPGSSPVPSDTSPTCAGGLLCADVEFGVIEQQDDFFKTCPYECDSNDDAEIAECRTCFSCIAGLAYSNIAFGQITPFFTALISQPGSTIRNVFALQMCIDDSRIDADQTSRLFLWSDVGAATPDFAGLTRNNTPVMYTPIVAENYYSVQVTSMWVAGVEMAVGCAALNSPGPSILDSGTSSLMLPTPVLQAFAARIAPIIKSVLPAGATAAQDAETVEKVVFAGGCYTFPDEVRSALPNISFGFQSATAAGGEFLVTVPADHYLVSCCIDAANNPGCVPTWRFMVQESSCAVTTSATLGLPLLTEFVVVFDRASSQIGFGVAAGCTGSDGAGTQVSVGPLRQRANPSESCASTYNAQCPQTAAAAAGLGSVELVLVIVCSVAVVVILLLLVDTLKSKRKLERMDRPRAYRQLNPAMSHDLMGHR